MGNRLSKRYATAWAIFVGLVACGGDNGGGNDSTSSVTATDTDTDGLPTGPGETDVTATDATTTGVATDATTTAPTSGTAETVDPPGSSSSGSDPDAPVEDGELCDDAEDCISGFCFNTGILGGICGACATDADCDAGCHPPNPFAEPAVPSSCEADGGEGAACETAGSCDGAASCGLVFNLPGVFEVRGCGSCEVTKDCIKGSVCTPTYDLANLGGSRACVPAGTLADGQHCDPQDSPDACINFCRRVDFAELATVGVCSPCAGNGDCMMDQACEPATVAEDGIELVPAVCVDIPPPKR